jgi:hypothetical protein
MIGRRVVQISPSDVDVQGGVQGGVRRIVRMAPKSVRVSVLGFQVPLRYMNLCSRLEGLHCEIRNILKVRKLKLTRPMLYNILKGIVLRKTWEMDAFFIFTDFISEIYNVSADICRLCKVRETTLLQYLAGYIGTSEVQKRIVDAGLRIGAIAY